jgi:hypothetical protein
MALPSDETIHEQAYLISRGVRPLALVGVVDGDKVAMLRAYNKLESVRCGLGQAHEPIPVVMQRSDGHWADVGFAARAWVSDTLKWCLENTPQPHLQRILGLMLGYSPDAIAALEESESGALFPEPTTESPAPDAS